MSKVNKQNFLNYVNGLEGDSLDIKNIEQNYAKHRTVRNLAVLINDLVNNYIPYVGSHLFSEVTREQYIQEYIPYLQLPRQYGTTSAIVQYLKSNKDKKVVVLSLNKDMAERINSLAGRKVTVVGADADASALRNRKIDVILVDNTYNVADDVLEGAIFHSMNNDIPIVLLG